MKYYLIAGEASGDLHGSNLMKAIRSADPDAHFRVWGGDLMKDAGGHLVKHYRQLAFMGFVEVIRNLPAILNNLKECKKDIQAYHPDVLVLIDYPGFNLRIAKWAKEQHLKIVYYISPQVWAWKAKRVMLIRKVVDKMLVILPFEKDFYNRYAYPVQYVGHPLIQVVDEFLSEKSEPEKNAKPVIAILPGSRKQEIMKKLPLMLQASAFFPSYQFILGKAPSQDDSFYDGFLKEWPEVKTVRNTYALLQSATAALVTSGTATLETALFGVPQVVCYKGSPVSYHIAKRLVKIKYISLVNLIMDRQVITELIQDELTLKNITQELKKILNPENRKKIIADYDELRKLLQQGGNASQKAALEIIQLAGLSTDEPDGEHNERRKKEQNT